MAGNILFKSGILKSEREIGLIKCVVEARRATYGTLTSPNPNISRSRVRFLMKWTRIKHLIYYLLVSFLVYRRQSQVLTRRYNYAFMICSNTPTHAALLPLLESKPDLVIYPPGFRQDSMPNKSDKLHLNYQTIYIDRLVSLRDVFFALRETLVIFLYGIRTPGLNLEVLDFSWLFVSLIEASAIAKLKIDTLFLTHHLDSPALVSLRPTATRYEAGLHGFPVANYGYTPVWTDVFYAYGRSTEKYLKKRDPSCANKIKFYKNNLPGVGHIELYDAATIGLIVGGSYEDLLNIVAAAKEQIKKAKFSKMIVFRHPSRNLTSKELNTIKILNLSFIVTTLGEYSSDVAIRSLIGNSTALFSALSKGIIVFRTPSMLPTFDENVIVDGVSIETLENLSTYIYPGVAIHVEAIKKQLGFHFA